MRNGQKQIVKLETALAASLCFGENPYAKRTEANRKVGNRFRDKFVFE